MNITKKWLKEESACTEGYEWALYVLGNKPMKDVEFLNALIADDKLDWANWVIIRVFDDTQRRRYAIFEAEQVIHIYEKAYPNDNRPRKAIEAAKAYLDNPTPVWVAAMDAAWVAVRDVAWTVAWETGRDAVGVAAWVAASAAAKATAWAAAYKQMLTKILDYGITLL